MGLKRAYLTIMFDGEEEMVDAYQVDNSPLFVHRYFDGDKFDDRWNVVHRTGYAIRTKYYTRARAVQVARDILPLGDWEFNNLEEFKTKDMDRVKEYLGYYVPKTRYNHEAELLELASLKGFTSMEELIGYYQIKSTMPGMCLVCGNIEDCVEPDQDHGYCHACTDNKVQSVLVLAGLI